jgi:secondary thiamine-phosphate synthase enzyme
MEQSNNRMVIKVSTEKQFTNLNKIAADFVKDKRGAGMLNLFVRHATCGLKIIENEILLLADINQHLDNLAPKDGKYLHDITEIRDVPINERVNGASHIRQLYFPTSISVPVEDGQLMLGKWQTIFLVELDPIREREIVLSYITL